MRAHTGSEMSDAALKYAFPAAGILAIGGMAFGPHPIVGPVLALLPLAAITALPRAFLLAVLFILFSFFRLHEVFPQLMPLKLPLLLALGTLAALGFSLAFRRMQPFWDPLFTPFFCFFLASTLGIVFASNVGNSLGFFKDTYVKIGIMVFALAWSIRTEREINWLLRAVVLASLAVAAVTLKNKALGLELVEGTRVTIGRSIGSMLGDPNDLSLVLLFGVAFALSTAITKGMGPVARIAGASTYALLAMAIVATQSRGGLLGLAAVTGVFVAQRIKSKLILGVLGALALMVLFALAGVNDRQSGGAHEEGIDESAMGRIHAWQAAINMGLYNPLTGIGIDNFLFNYFDYSSFWDGKPHAVHSTWFGVLGETGILGLGLFIWMMVTLFFAIRRLSAEAREDVSVSPILRAASNGLLGGFTGFCVSGTFLTQGFTWPIYIILAVTIAVRRVADASVCNRPSSEMTQRSERRGKFLAKSTL